MPDRPSSFERLPVWSRVGALMGALTLVSVLILIAFAWPTSSARPRGLPMVVAPAAAAPQVQRQLAAGGVGDLFTVTGVPDEAAARQAIVERDALGAIVIGPSGPAVLKAGAASPASSQLLDQLAATLSTGKPPVGAVDVVPSPPGDPHGSAFAIAVLPFTLSALIIGAVFGMTVRPRMPRLVGVLGTSIAAGVCFTLVLHNWLDLLGGGFTAEASVITLVLAAVSVSVSGLVGLLGPPGMGIGAGIFVLLGVPLAGLAAPWQALPEFWGALGRFLPAGAGGELLRRVSFFPDASVAFPLLVTAGWLTVGLLLTGAVRPGNRSPASAPKVQPLTGSARSSGSSIRSSSTEPTPINEVSSNAASSGRNGRTVAM